MIENKTSLSFIINKNDNITTLTTSDSIKYFTEIIDIHQLYKYILSHKKDLQHNLHSFCQNQPDIFDILFQQQHLVPAVLIDNTTLKTLLDASILYYYQEFDAVQATVKINAHQGFFFFTDFISRIKDRSFSFLDEGFIQYKFFDDLVAQHLPDKNNIKAWDVCSGPANPLVFMEHKLKENYNNISLVGTEINARAVNYGKINLLLNNCAYSEILENDLDNAFEKSVLFDYIWANPPFGLSPQFDLLHTFGGKYGTMVVEKVLEKIKLHLAPKGVAQVLSYSVGNSTQLKIAHLIQQVFEKEASDFDINIKILENEKIWRYHGIKSCLNPMPIEYIALRANDPGYNTNNISRDDWVKYANQLKGEGYTQLYFILINIYRK